MKPFTDEWRQNKRSSSLAPIAAQSQNPGGGFKPRRRLQGCSRKRADDANGDWFSAPNNFAAYSQIKKKGLATDWRIKGIICESVAYY